MKPINKIFIVMGICGLVSMTSCIDKGPDPDFDIIPGNTLTAPENGASFDLASIKNVVFEWTASEAADGGYVSYEVLFDKADGDFSEPVSEMASGKNGGNTKLTVNAKDLNEVAVLAGIAPASTGTLQWTVRASKGILGSVYSQVNTIQITTLAE